MSEPETGIVKVDPKTIPLTETEMTYKTLEMLIATPTVPTRYKGSKTGVQDMLAAVLVGKELGVGPMESINSIYLVNGQVAMTGKLMSALVHRAGHQIRLSVTAKSVTATAYRRDYVTHELTEMGSIDFTEADAKRAGLNEKPTYKAYPKIMWGWRAISAVCRFYFGDVISGMASYVPEELNIEAPVEPIPMETELIVEGQMLDVEEVITENAVADVVDVLDAEVIQ